MTINTDRFFSGPHSSCAVIGAQWGDEGKGKIVDVLSEDADVVVRYQGGDNAGHTVVTNGDKTVLHALPSGAIRGKTCVLGRGMVINPEALLEDLKAVGDKVGDVIVDLTAPVITPFHIALDEPEDEEGEIGTTSRGIGPTYASFVARDGLRFTDFHESGAVREKVQKIFGKAYVEAFIDGDEDKIGSTDEIREVTSRLKSAFYELIGMGVKFTDAGKWLRDKLNDRKTKVLFEGAQGTMLDVGLGNYPYVTSSHPTSGGIAPGTGISPDMVDHLVGVTKAYTTRVGKGPFFAEKVMQDSTKREIRDKGNEYGATTGRPRRCGWIDLPALRYACKVNGFDELVMTKLDVLSGHGSSNVLTLSDYKVENDKTLETHSPAYISNVKSFGVDTYKGWDEDITNVRSFSDLPPEAMTFVSAINDAVEPPLNVLSVGPDREETFTW